MKTKHEPIGLPIGMCIHTNVFECFTEVEHDVYGQTRIHKCYIFSAVLSILL